MNKTVSNILNHLYFSPSLVQWVIFDILTRKYWSTCHTLTILIKNTHFIMSKCWIISKHSRKTHFWNIILKYPPHLTSGIMVYTLIKRNFDVERVFYRWDHLNVNFYQKWNNFDLKNTLFYHRIKLLKWQNYLFYICFIKELHVKCNFWLHYPM